MRLTKGTLLVVPDDIETITESGVYIPASAQQLPNSGIVLKSGKDCKCFAGDRVDFMNGSLELLDDGTAFIKESQCFCMFEGKERLLNKMRVHDGWVIVKIPYMTREGKTAGGIHLPASKSSEVKAMETIRHGEVYKTCRNAFNENDPIISTYFNKDNNVGVKKGDKVFFSAYAINSIRAGVYFYNSHIVAPDGTEYVLIPYKELICKFDGENFIGLSGYAVACAKPPKQKSGLILPQTAEKLSPTEYVAETNSKYFRKGDTLFFGMKDQLVTLETGVNHIFEKLYVYFKEDKPTGINEGSELDFRKKSKLVIA